MAAASRWASRAGPTYAYPPPLDDAAASYSSSHGGEDTPFEFDEADVWSNDVVARVPSFETTHDGRSTMPSSRRRPPRKRADISSALKPAAAAASSLPVDILDRSKKNPKWDSYADDGGGRVESDEESEEEGGRESRVPPHEYLARRRGASLSVHEGIGRTLKGRDLSRMRDAIWKSVGFAD